MIVVFSRPGREAITVATVEQLETHGGGHLLPLGTKRLFWVGESDPPAIPSTWEPLHLRRAPAGSVIDFWALLDAFPGEDLTVFEDDVRACRNALPYIDSWPFSAGLTSFFNPQARPLGLNKITADRGFVYSQAIKLPRAIALLLRDAGPSTSRKDHDVAIGDVMRLQGRPIYYHRTLVEHVAATSVARGGGARPRYAPDYLGVDFDAFTLGGDAT